MKNASRERIAVYRIHCPKCGNFMGYIPRGVIVMPCSVCGEGVRVEITSGGMMMYLVKMEEETRLLKEKLGIPMEKTDE